MWILHKIVVIRHAVRKCQTVYCDLAPAMQVVSLNWLPHITPRLPTAKGNMQSSQCGEAFFGYEEKPGKSCEPVDLAVPDTPVRCYHSQPWISSSPTALMCRSCMQGQSALRNALKKGQAELVELLLSHGCNMDETSMMVRQHCRVSNHIVLHTGTLICILSWLMALQSICASCNFYSVMHAGYCFCLPHCCCSV